MKYDTKDCNTFVRAMKRNGREVRHYRGRWYWEGPAVTAGRYELDEVMSLTRVKLQYDNLGLDYIVYPIASGRLVTDEQPKEETLD